MKAPSADTARHAAAAGRNKRSELSRLRTDMLAGRVSWQDVIVDPPECVHGMFLSELLLLVPYVHRHRVEVLGEKAFREGITLLVRCERASSRTREWVVDNVLAQGTVLRARPRGTRRRAGMRTGVLLP